MLRVRTGVKTVRDLPIYAARFPNRLCRLAANIGVPAYRIAECRLFAQDSLLRQDRHLTLPQTPGCGFGWRIGKDPTGEDIVHHSGLAIGARSSLVVYPDARYTVSVLSNAEWVSSIEQTASMLAAPFRTRPNKLASPCPISVARYEGTFGADKIAGTASFSIVDGQCRGVLSTDNAAGAWFNGLFQKDAEQLQIFALTEDGQFGRSALVTPSGIYDFALKADGSYSAVLGATRAFTVRFSSNTAGSSGDR